jgi:hypothetical protein
MNEETLTRVWAWATGIEGAPFVAFAWAAIVVGYEFWFYVPRLSPDGERYLAIGRGKPVPRPYSYRWLLPALFRTDTRLWVGFSYLALCVAAFEVALWAGGTWGGLFAAVLFTGATGLFRTSVMLPVITEPVSFALSLGAALMFRGGHTAGGVILSMLAGACRESAPVFIACWTLNPWALVGLVTPKWLGRYAEPDAEYLSSPFQDARKIKRETGLDFQFLLRPWGVVCGLFPLLLPAAAPRLVFAALLSLTLSYAQLLRARDYSRLYQWAWPAVIPICANVSPEYAPALILLHFALLPNLGTM